MENTMTQTEKEQYELTIKNMQSKIDWLRDQRKLLDTYGKKYEPLTDDEMWELWQPKKPEYSDPCPDCGKQLFVAAGGGVKCTCGYWSCF